MFLAPFHTSTPESINITPEQASNFAKGVAHDFNPIHDPDNKRFCVPGDLLFSLVLNRYGIAKKMHFRFEGMVGANAELVFPEQPSGQFAITDKQQKTFLTVSTEGEAKHCPLAIETFATNYVAFSGLNFNEALVPLMRQHQLMINPARPLVIYEQMEFEFDTLDVVAPTLQPAGADMVVNGKRGDVTLSFDIIDNGMKVGTGSKKLVMSSLRAYCQDSLNDLCESYQARQQSFAIAS
ncbi:DUF3581 domain-containing protein [Paraferrimonas sp. SM1919]|uniref:DUF3581 domain-containing protein n=1 Tax=Paraferrimonas sp. SM1919 TaxID=2662263 RepID=UPI0013CFCA9F|nr:DUF3581 domain-containing protein [Paraferrimonas sp. SM1919]